MNSPVELIQILWVCNCCQNRLHNLHLNKHEKVKQKTNTFSEIFSQCKNVSNAIQERMYQLKILNVRSPKLWYVQVYDKHSFSGRGSAYFQEEKPRVFTRKVFLY